MMDSQSGQYSSCTPSTSPEYREKGNSIFKSVTDDTSYGTSCSRLEEALAWYLRALSLSDCPDDDISANKNAAVTYRKLARLYIKKGPKERHIQAIAEDRSSISRNSIRDNFKASLSHYAKALIKIGYKSNEYKENLNENMRSCYQEMTEWLSDKAVKTRVNVMSDIISALPECQLKAESYISLGTMLFHNGITAWQQEDYKECHRCMKECYFPIEESRRLCKGDKEIQTKAQTVEEDVYLHTCIAESRMARKTGEDLLIGATRDQEYLNIDMIWIIIDWFTQAILLSAEKDLEQEAIANARLGNIYDKVLNLRDRAKISYKRAVHLAFSLEPRNFDTCEWFRESTEFLREYQRRFLGQDEFTEERKRVLEEIKQDVDKLRKLDESSSESASDQFLKALYKKWPPKNKPGEDKPTLHSTLTSSNKKQLTKALLHYHPDKQDKDKFGLQWYYLCEEIAKVLNRRYASIKCEKETLVTRL